MSPFQRRFSLLLLLGSSALFPRSAGAAAPPGGYIDYCKTQAADDTLWVPLQFNTAATVLSSESGAYAYGDRACKYYIADVKMATYSHSYNYDGEWIATPMLYDAGPYDLPSSSHFGGAIPTVQEDCERLTVQTRVYTKLNGETAFTLQGTLSQVGIWSSGVCNLVTQSSSGAFPPSMEPSASGWDTYRVAVRAKLRSTYQEVGVTFSEPPPR
jgi:hypothetical protein